MWSGSGSSSESWMERRSTSESMEWGTTGSTDMSSICDSGLVGDMGGVIGARDRESFLAIGWKTLRPLVGRGGATVGKEVERGVENMAV
jgi:hypothetical protein